MTPARKPEVLIVGAGIGGLTAALALHARGVRATVWEAARQLRPLGVGIDIQPFAVAQLVALGLGDALARSGIPTRVNHHLDHTGTFLWTDPRGLAAGYAHPQYPIHRGRLQMMVLAAVRERLGPEAVRLDTRLHDFEQTRHTVRAYARDGRGSLAAREFEALIGADGLHSTVRSRLHPDEGPPNDSGVHMWRGVTELPTFLDGRTMILAADDEDTRLIAHPVSARHARRGRALVNWVCLVSAPPPDGIREADWNKHGSREDVVPHHAHWDFGRLDVPGPIRGSHQVLQYPMVDRDPLGNGWHGRVTLLGDAAHPVYPLGGEGASHAVLDAVALGAELGRGDAVTSALNRYEAHRRPASTAAVITNRDGEDAAHVKTLVRAAPSPGAGRASSART
ncbi:FAD-dependent monooxygenase [Streptomyces sp. NRRL B-24572]|uniref:FAD-dependent monooxygenase n=1 Tax=Streptomyces sp. NRRL B-24572 TaxID=1962156 RepID=UPI000A380892|nr:FAD-dependent monooxygenase [Streptomyces sp. NRRL B-24572]